MAAGENRLLLKSKPRPEPVTLEATLVFKLPDKLVAMCSRGFFYYWFFKPGKSLGFPLKEGDMMFVVADPETRDCYSMAPQNAQAPVYATQEGA
jgi:hypothetical protein